MRQQNHHAATISGSTSNSSHLRRTDPITILLPLLPPLPVRLLTREFVISEKPSCASWDQSCRKRRQHGSIPRRQAA